MTRRTSARTLAGACLFATAAAMPGAPASAQSSTVLGGWRPAATDNQLVQEGAAFLAAQVGGELASVDAAQSGSRSYRLEITLADGARWSGTVTVQSDRSFTLSGQPTQLSPPPGEGEETDTGSNQAPDEDEDDDD